MMFIALGGSLWLAGMGRFTVHAAAEPDGYAWHQLNPLLSPGPRYLHCLAYDSRRNRTVLFGGMQLHDSRNRDPHLSEYTKHWRWWSDFSWESGYVCLSDTWEFDGRSWHLRTPAHTPPAGAFVMAFDEVRGVTVLCAVRHIWEWDGEDWTAIRPNGTVPDGVAFGAMAYDSRRSVHILLGNRGDDWETACETWEFNGADRSWTLRTTSGPETRRIGIAFDAARNRTVLYGGYLHDGWRDANGEYKYQVRDTWLYDGQAGSWSKQVMPADRGPYDRYNAGIAYHGGLEVVMILGGVAESAGPEPPYPLTYAWEPRCFAWDGSSWSWWDSGQHYHNSPHAMVYESGRQQILTYDTIYQDSGRRVDLNQEAPPPPPPATWVYSREPTPTPPILYVDPARATDTQDGSFEHPFRTVRQAVARATPDTIVGIAAGDYVETPITFAFPGRLDVSLAGGSVTIR
jgi:hypothetical protein